MQRSLRQFKPFLFPSLALLLLLLCLSPGTVRAQDVRATIGGRVTDPQGAVIPDAVVTVTSKDTNVKRTTATNDRGLWQIQALLPGSYSFRVVSPGFRISSAPTSPYRLPT